MQLAACRDVPQLWPRSLWVICTDLDLGGYFASIVVAELYSRPAHTTGFCHIVLALGRSRACQAWSTSNSLFLSFSEEARGAKKLG